MVAMIIMSCGHVRKTDTACSLVACKLRFNDEKEATMWRAGEQGSNEKEQEGQNPRGEKLCELEDAKRSMWLQHRWRMALLNQFGKAQPFKTSYSRFQETEAKNYSYKGSHVE